MKIKLVWHYYLVLSLFYLSFPAWSDHKNNLIKETIYFYNPETNINNFVSLKKSFDNYLAKFDAFQFQPFNNKDLFEHSIIEHPHGIYLLSSWHFQSLPDEIDIKPVMVGVIKEKSTQKKILAVSHSINKIIDLKGVTLACSGNKQYTQNLLKEMLGNRYSDIFPTINLLFVPKDIDALMAVGFGLASAALTSKNSFINLHKINPKQHQLLKPLIESQPHFLVLMAIPSVSNKESHEIIDILEKMGINPEGEIQLRMLGLDGWRKLTQQEQFLLIEQRKKNL